MVSGLTHKVIDVSDRTCDFTIYFSRVYSNNQFRLPPHNQETSSTVPIQYLFVIEAWKSGFGSL